jgi:hypothetical protein
VKTLIYLFNGCGWGDHFLSIPYLNRQIKLHGPENVMVITYQNHVDNLFKNFPCHFVGVEKANFCFEKIKSTILNFEPKRIISFNAFYPFDFDFFAMRIFNDCEFYGKFNRIGMSINYSFKKYAHIRDQYFLLSNEKIKYSRSDRKFLFNSNENHFYHNYFTKKLGRLNFKKIIILHLDSEERKLWSEQNVTKLINKLLDSEIKVLIVGVKSQILKPDSKHFKNLFILNEKEIRSIFWLISRCKYFIGIDSVFAHVADAYDKSSIILFSDYLSHEWYHNSPNISTIYPETGMKTKDISFKEVLFEIEQKFPFNIQ